LPEVLTLLRASGRIVDAHAVDDPGLVLGINDRVGLAAARALAQRRILEDHMRAGVTVVDPGSTLIDADVVIGADTVVEPATYLRGATTIGGGARIGPNTTVIDSAIGDGAVVLHAYLQEAELQAGATVGPFAYLRPGAVLREGAKVGTFVE